MKYGIVCWGICSLLLLGGCRPAQQDVAVSGVSRELAAYRKSTLSEVKYDLLFRIPSLRTERVEGILQLSFILEKPGRIVLDFREDPENIREVKVNDRVSDYRFGNEHLVIPSAETVAGINRIYLSFAAGEQSLNRNADYLYTLFVPDRARTVFPCFDQPDLKARFRLTLELPENWTAVSNAPRRELVRMNGRCRMVFAETEPLSTYLFSFVAGRFQQVTYSRGDREISAFHRESDPQKLAQLPVIADQVFAALDWMEKYTGIPYPFAKYDLIILPGFQFGGMEHTGATLYNDKRMFLSENPTLGEQLGRAELIAHETAHMWFGDYVTMKWFDDVWTKEVFANYFAARMVEPLFPSIDHELNALKSFYASAYSEDRTVGSTAIKQPLENLNQAGLIYGQIVYNKAPIVMRMLTELMGEKAFQQGIREYLNTYAYGNADWEGLIGILDRYTPADLKTWSRVWVNEKGMPEIRVKRTGKQSLLVQTDPFGRGLYWPQTIGLLLIKGDSLKKVEVDLSGPQAEIPEGNRYDYILPGCDGKSYGYFAPDTATLQYCLSHLERFEDPLIRMAVLMMLNENYLNGRIPVADFLRALLHQLKEEEQVQLYSVLASYVSRVCTHPQTRKDEVRAAEKVLLELSRTAGNGEFRQTAFRTLLNIFNTPESIETVYRIWKEQQPFEGLYLNESDYRKMAFELGVRLPDRWSYIEKTQESRISNPDRLREFQYIARAITPLESARDSLFRSLLKAENRRIEPWTASVLSYLNHPLRQQQALKYIRPALEVLQDVQRTGDIFFPKNWISSCLGGHSGKQAADSVDGFLKKHPAYPILLKNKILQSADPLYRLKKIQKNKAQPL